MDFDHNRSFFVLGERPNIREACDSEESSDEDCVGVRLHQPPSRVNDIKQKYRAVKERGG